MILDTINNLLDVIPVVFQIQNLLFIVGGVLIGVIMGALPGLSTTMALAVMLPLTFWMDSLVALILLVAIYVGGMFGGSISAILLNIPGTPSAVATAFDGFPLSQQGKAGYAIGMAAISSCFGGLLGAIILSFATPPISNFALRFGYIENFAVAVFGLSIMSSVSGKYLSTGLLGGMIGLFASTIGLDPITNIPRFTFGSQYLLSGINLVPLMLGLFGLSEVINRLSEKYIEVKDINKIEKTIPSFRELKKYFLTMIRSSLIGTFMGALPAVGGSVTCIVAYNETKRVSKNPDLFGKGAIEGVISSESANNATACGAMIPMLTLGIPGDPQTAVLIGAFLIHNLRPGPLLMSHFPVQVYSVFLTFFLASLLILVIGLIGSKYISKVLLTPSYILLPIVAALCLIGAYSINNSVMDVYIALIFGVIGFIFRKFEIPNAPVILGAMLGSMAEINLRTSLLISSGDYSILFSSAIGNAFYFVTLISLSWPLISKIIKNKSKKQIV